MRWEAPHYRSGRAPHLGRPLVRVAGEGSFGEALSLGGPRRLHEQSERCTEVAQSIIGQVDIFPSGHLQVDVDALQS